MQKKLLFLSFIISFVLFVVLLSGLLTKESRENAIRAKAKEQLEPEIRARVEEQLEPEIRAEVEEQLEPEIRAEVEAQLEAERRTELKKQLEPEIRAEAEAQMEAEIREEIKEELASKVREEVATQTALEKIELFTRHMFRYTEDVWFVVDNGKISVYISFIPEVGSFPVKEDIYESAANHAMQIIRFYPEVNFFEYTVLWGYFSKEEVLTLEIDEEAIKQVEQIYYAQLTDGGETFFSKVFSAIIETEESKKWRVRVDPNPNSNVP